MVASGKFMGFFSNGLLRIRSKHGAKAIAAKNRRRRKNTDLSASVIPESFALLRGFLPQKNAKNTARQSRNQKEDGGWKGRRWQGNDWQRNNFETWSFPHSPAQHSSAKSSPK